MEKKKEKKVKFYKIKEFCGQMVVTALQQWNVLNAREGFPGDAVVKNPPASAGALSSVPGWEASLEKEWQPTPVFLPRKSHGHGAWQPTVQGVTQELDMT